MMFGPVRFNDAATVAYSNLTAIAAFDPSVENLIAHANIDFFGDFLCHLFALGTFALDHHAQ